MGDMTLTEKLDELAEEHGPEAVLEAAMERFGAPAVTELYEREDGDTGWRTRSVNGKILAASGEGYKNDEHAEHMARGVTGRAPVRR